jgi:hypothetical protein
MRLVIGVEGCVVAALARISPLPVVTSSIIASPQAMRNREARVRCTALRFDWVRLNFMNSQVNNAVTRQ